MVRTIKRVRSRHWAGALVIAACFAGSSTHVFSQSAPAKTPAAAASTSPSKGAPEEGIPVTDKLVVSKCSGCHKQDEKGNLSRISYIRTTPEGWEEAIKRMVRLHNVNLSPAEARRILLYLSDDHGLAPEESKLVAYMSEQRMIDEKVPSEVVSHACKACHPLGRPLAWHRTAEDWKLLGNMHVAFFPPAQSYAFDAPHRRPGAPPPPPNADKRPPLEQAIDYFAKTNPLHTPEWAGWHASMRAPKLDGRWLISGSQPGKGKFYGEMVIEAAAGAETISTKTKVTFVRGETTMTNTGSAVVYTGYAWRGRSAVQSTAKGVDTPQTVREVMTLSRDQMQMEGRWFWGSYNEFGMDVTLRRATDGPLVLGTDMTSYKAGASGAQIRIFGDHLPSDIRPEDIDLGAGVTVTKVVSKRPDSITVLADVAASAIPGRRDVVVKHSVAPGAFAVYKQVDYIKVSTPTSLAHLGGDKHPKGYWQFEAIGYANGPDGLPNTPDDIDLGPLAAQWKLEEFVASYNDDDTKFVGTLNGDTGLFVPAVDGPNPARRQSRNNYGDVWVVATVKPSGSDKALLARGYLIVSVPQYVRWDQPEVAQLSAAQGK